MCIFWSLLSIFSYGNFFSTWGSVDGFPVVFPERSQEFGCTRPCRWYDYTAECNEAKKGDENSYLKIVKEKAEPSAEDKEEGITKVVVM